MCCVLLIMTVTCMARDTLQINPPFPRIANCYGAGLSWKSWDEGSNYWCKLSLILGGCYDLHYDWENPRWPQTLIKAEENINKLRQVNPHVLVLPYVDVIEGPDNPNVPKSWWALNEKKERWSGWPGYYRINTGLPEVLQFNLDKVRQDVFGRECFDGVFYDCWKPDGWLVPQTAKLRDGKAVVMINDWNLPTNGFETLNGALAEDEINRVVEGKVEFEDFITRYLRWTRTSRKPAVTTIVCRPQSINDDPWRWEKMTGAQRKAIAEQARVDEQTMRFGLTTTLMGDGYFGYDSGTQGRGNWWWYKEYDAPLGHPKGSARRNPDGTWQRDFDGGTVVVNGSAYDVVISLEKKHRDVSTGRVGMSFTIPFFDGRILLPTDNSISTTPDIAPRLTAVPPVKLTKVNLDNGMVVIRTPGGLELRFDKQGTLQRMLWRGRVLMSGGWPVVVAPPWINFTAENVSTLTDLVTDTELCLQYRGKLVLDAQQVGFVETCSVRSNDQFTLKFEFTAMTDLNLRMWRHYFAFPVSSYAGMSSSAGDKSVSLPLELKETELLPAANHFVLETKKFHLAIDGSLPLGLIDHRKYGTPEYLLAGYPVSNTVKQDKKWSVEFTVSVTDRR